MQPQVTQQRPMLRYMSSICGDRFNPQSLLMVEATVATTEFQKYTHQSILVVLSDILSHCYKSLDLSEDKLFLFGFSDRYGKIKVKLHKDTGFTLTTSELYFDCYYTDISKRPSSIEWVPIISGVTSTQPTMIKFIKKKY